MQARLVKEQGELVAQQYAVNPKAQNLWEITIGGPETSPFEGGNFKIQFKLDNFPFKGPQVTFMTKVFHPNISEKGEVCPEMIGITDKWAPTKRLLEVIGKIKELMLVPNPDMPLNQTAADSFKSQQWRQQAKNWTQTYAK